MVTPPKFYAQLQARDHANLVDQLRELAEKWDTADVDDPHGHREVCAQELRELLAGMNPVQS